METTNWAEEVADKSLLREVYPEFLRHIAPLELIPAQITGKVMIIGQAIAFPEKTLICTPESKFKSLRDGVETVYCCDTTYPSSPERHLNIPCINTIFEDKVPAPKPNTAYFEPSISDDFLEKMDPDFLDTVLMCRVPDIGKQIEENGLLEKIALHLKAGGFFIFTGGQLPLNLPENYFKPLRLIRAIKLGYTGDGFPSTNNMGVILKKEQ